MQVRLEDPRRVREAHAHLCMCMCTCACACACMRVCIGVHGCAWVCIGVHGCAWVFVCSCVCVRSLCMSMCIRRTPCMCTHMAHIAAQHAVCHPSLGERERAVPSGPCTQHEAVWERSMLLRLYELRRRLRGADGADLYAHVYARAYMHACTRTCACR